MSGGGPGYIDEVIPQTSITSIIHFVYYTISSIIHFEANSNALYYQLLPFSLRVTALFNARVFVSLFRACAVQFDRK